MKGNGNPKNVTKDMGRLSKCNKYFILNKMWEEPLRATFVSIFVAFRALPENFRFSIKYDPIIL